MPLSSALKLILGPLLLVSLLFGGTASADNVDRLTKQLSTSSDYKVRISAALSLSKLRDQRAVWPFVKALKDSDKTVRGVAAASLGKTVNSSTSEKMRARVLQELKKAATSDSNAFVRKQSQKAFDALGKIGASAVVTAGGIYVNIGLMSAQTEDASKIRNHMRKTVQKTFKKQASSMMIDWPGGKDPKGPALKKQKVKAFHVDGTINEAARFRCSLPPTQRKVCLVSSKAAPKFGRARHLRKFNTQKRIV